MTPEDGPVLPPPDDDLIDYVQVGYPIPIILGIVVISILIGLVLGAPR